MSLTPGQPLSFYEILGPLGAGGMGEVYRARDTRLEREVAIKVLPEELADDDERLRRFEREAKTLASLNHPNVAGIHGVDQVEDVCFLALELVPGSDLAERLQDGALPVEEALDVCRQIAEGLEAAHEAGVIHRDLKPANVRVTPHGTAKLLDFGLAKPTRVRGASGSATRAEPDSVLATEEGLLLGTPTYMSPEQARGKPVDRRTDVWALGCVLFECLTGRRAFSGETFPDVVASIVGKEPDWDALPPLPPRVDALLRRMLVKDPRSRLRDAGEARVQLELARGEPVVEADPSGQQIDRGPAMSFGYVVAAAVLLAIGLAAGAFFGGASSEPVAPAATQPKLRFEVAQHESNVLQSDYALSPGGSHVAWNDLAGVHVRALDTLETRTIVAPPPGSDRLAEPVHAIAWSPDGTALAYCTKDKLWRVDVAGGAPVAVAQGEGLALAPDTLVWLPDDTLVSANPESDALSTAPAGGGTITPLLFEGPDDTLHFDAVVAAPGGGLVLARHRQGLGIVDTLSLYEDGVLTDLTRLDDWMITWIDCTAEAIWIIRVLESDRALWRLPFSAAERAVTGEPELVRSGVVAARVDASGTSLQVLEGGRAQSEIVWLDFEGELEPLERTFDGEWLMLSLTHAQDAILVNHFTSKSTVWSYDLERKVFVPVQTFAEATSTLAGTLPDGRLLASSFGALDTLAYPADGRGDPERIVQGVVADVTRDGAHALVIDNPMGGTPMLQAYELGSSEAPRDLRASVSVLTGLPRLSPDGNWLLFNAERNGETNVLLTRFPSGEGEWQVSVGGGGSAWFGDDDGFLYYQKGGLFQEAALELWRVPFVAAPGVQLGAPERLLTMEDPIDLAAYHAPTQRFVGIRRRSSAQRQLVIETGVR